MADPQGGGNVGFSPMDPTLAAGDVKPPSWKKSLLGLIPVAGPILLKHQQQQYASDVLKKEQQVSQNNSRLAYFATMSQDPTLSDNLRSQARDQYLSHIDFLTEPGNYSKPLPPDISKKADAITGAINAHKAMMQMQAQGQIPQSLQRPPGATPQGQMPAMPPSLATPGQPLAPPAPGPPQSSPGTPGMQPQGSGPAEVPLTDIRSTLPSPGSPQANLLLQYQDVLQSPIGRPYVQDLLSGNPLRQSRAEFALQGLRDSQKNLSLKMEGFRQTYGDPGQYDPQFVADVLEGRQPQYPPALNPGQIRPPITAGGQATPGAPRLESIQPGAGLVSVPTAVPGMPGIPPPPGAAPQSSGATTLVQGGPKLTDEQQAANAQWEAKHPGQKITPDKYAGALSDYKEQAMSPTEKDQRLETIAYRKMAEANLGAVQGLRQEQLDMRKEQQVLASREQQQRSLDKVGQPINDAVKNFSVVQDLLDQNNPQADSLLAPAVLKAVVGGSGSGVRITQAEIKNFGDMNQWQNIKSALEKWQVDPTKPFKILPPERQMLRNLGGLLSRKLQAKQKIVQDASDDLASSRDLDEHMKIVNGAKKEIANIDTGKTQLGQSQGLTPPPGSAAPLPATLSAADVGKVYTNKEGKQIRITAVNPANAKQFKFEEVK